MSKITVDRAVLNQALEVLQQIDDAMPFPVAKQMMKALREALAQPQQEPVPPTIAGVSPQLFAQQIAHAMRYADAPLSHDQFVTLVLYLKARFDDYADNAELCGGTSATNALLDKDKP